MLDKYFQDRPEESTMKEYCYVGRKVFIVTKNMERYAKTIYHLDMVIIEKNIDKLEINPEGQYVIGDPVDPNVGKKLLGHVIYVMTNDGEVITKEGLKDIYLNSIIGTYRLYMIFHICDNFDIRVLLDPYKFYKNKSEIKVYINDLKKTIKECEYCNGFIRINVDNKIMRCEHFDILMDNEKIDFMTNLGLYDMLSDRKKPKSSSFSFGKIYEIEPKGFFIKQIKGD